MNWCWQGQAFSLQIDIQSNFIGKKFLLKTFRKKSCSSSVYVCFEIISSQVKGVAQIFPISEAQVWFCAIFSYIHELSERSDGVRQHPKALKEPNEIVQKKQKLQESSVRRSILRRR